MIIKTTGQLVCGDRFIAKPLMSEDAFRRSKYGSKSEENPMGEKWKMYRLHAESEDGYFGVNLFFHNGMLHACHLSFGTKGESWADFSVENERKRKVHHDMLLAKWLGVPPYVYSWGEIESVLHPKDNTASIIVKYAISA
ncbi:MAG: hypothetical protein K8S55_12770 [Phycisphaerae bacterium]|nr:hypothetical protein [Phycisphaerae bacterium]